MLFGIDRQKDVFEFNQSTFVAEHFKYSRLMSFRFNNIEYAIGEFVKFKGKENIFRIDKLFYNDNFPKPSLVMECTCFELLTNCKNIPKNSCRGDVIESSSGIEMFPFELLGKVEVIGDEAQHASSKKNDRLIFTCHHKLQNNKIENYIPKKVLFCHNYTNITIHM